MSQLRKKAREELAETLRKHLGECQWGLDRNKREMKRLVERQTITKRKISELNHAIKALVPFKESDNE